MNFNTPILLIIFNRPNITKKMMAILKKVKPNKLYIVSDGPRKNKIGEKDLVEQTRKIVLDNIDWKLELKTLFRDENIGGPKGISGGITWFFSQVENGIILEDDCISHKSFFPYCKTLLEKYKDDKDIMMISGNNFLEKSKIKIKNDYYFSNIAFTRGWATWKSSWEKFDLKINTWGKIKNTNFLQQLLGNKLIVNHYNKIFNDLYFNKEVHWDYAWQYNIFYNKGIVIRPKVNLISNIGFFGQNSKRKTKNHNIPTYSLKISNTINIDKKVNIYADKYEYKNVFNITYLKIAYKYILIKIYLLGKNTFLYRMYKKRLLKKYDQS